MATLTEYLLILFVLTTASLSVACWVAVQDAKRYKRTIQRMEEEYQALDRVAMAEIERVKTLLPGSTFIELPASDPRIK